LHVSIVLILRDIIYLTILFVTSFVDPIPTQAEQRAEEETLILCANKKEHSAEFHIFHSHRGNLTSTL